MPYCNPEELKNIIENLTATLSSVCKIAEATPNVWLDIIKDNPGIEKWLAAQKEYDKSNASLSRTLEPLTMNKKELFKFMEYEDE